VLLYYGFVRISAQEAYLNERNLRLLATLSEPLKAKVDSFDAALDHVQSFSIDRLETLDRGVRLFAPDLEVKRHLVPVVT
jgi:hypothetical protein